MNTIISHRSILISYGNTTCTCCNAVSGCDSQKTKTMKVGCTV